MTPKQIEKYVDKTLNWGERRMKFHEKKGDFKTCLAIAQEFHDWYTMEVGDEYQLFCVSVEPAE